MFFESVMKQETGNGDLKVLAFSVLPRISMDVEYLPTLLIATDSARFN